MEKTITNTNIPPKKRINQPETDAVYHQFSEFILGHNHPCVMAQSVFKLNQVDLHVYEELGTKASATKILKDIEKYLSKYDFESNNFETFIAVFRENKDYSEEEFEARLWEQLQYLHAEDIKKHTWDTTVSSDPGNDNFSFSLCGNAFYMVGMHPGSSRKARQSPYPAIAFNLHFQFESLRKMGVYHNVRDKIRERDKELQGNINPMLEDFGHSSEARQYSGRKVDEKWKCPFHQQK